jgi:diguanylate cyclase (GGDEF)-like protein/PAS domain S-box-containing protein
VAVEGASESASTVAPGGSFERHVLEHLPSALILLDANGLVTYWNRRAEILYGASAAEVLGRRFVDLDRSPDPVARAGFAQTIAAVLAGGRWAGDSDAHLADGSVVPVFATLEQFVHPDTGEVGVMCTSIEITERRRVEAHLVYEARHDPLTKLPNRRMFLDHLDDALAGGGDPVAVLFLDLDDFKEINDLDGHATGDAVLCAVADVLAGIADDAALVARLSGDEFVACCSASGGPGAAVALAERMLAALRTSPLPGGRIGVEASVGVAVSTAGMHSEALLRNADVAMYLAKERGRGQVQVFDDAIGRDRHERAMVERELVAALAEDQLEVHYQPIVDLRSGTLLGFEALLRWRHPERGLIGPDDFLAVAEQSGTIGEIGAMVLQTACQVAAGWSCSADGPQIAVNVSARQLVDAGFAETVQDALREAGLPPARLCLEVTESSLMEADAGITHLIELKALGVRIAIDDFGMGYSSLGRLRRLPVDTLKIDRSFVDGLGRDDEDDEIVRAVVGLAKSLRLAVVVEGVEDTVQLARATLLGCDAGQGFLWSRAVPAEETTALAATAVRFHPPIADHRHDAVLHGDDAELLDALVPYVAEGLRQGEGVVVVATEAHLQQLRDAVEAIGLEPDGFIGLDAEATLRSFLAGSSPDAGRFHAVTSAALVSVGAGRRPVRAYGEMVGILWNDRNVLGALQLEGLWEQLRGEVTFSLLCGYRVDRDDPIGTAALAEACHLHHRTVTVSPG